jgi:hypothetical protein
MSLVIDNWSAEQTHPAVIALLEFWSPNDRSYPIDDRESMQCVINALERFPRFAKYEARNPVSNDLRYGVVTERCDFSLWMSFNVYRLNGGWKALRIVDDHATQDIVVLQRP